ncbi:uncharacterized protein VICG_01395 [Vittaforma corneae ATCC 50505]|uniref:Uncharacterized protein n=1 Tax=Vittaforma corneae (strain ATCC 50505) TaxID=993615 RepID=L2GL00_VITCO|nr:uncharacterized protein VICG_01395 [Vittaforma corneae ATCC 50505]ELA41531.1 hypothetical protein VICG_01395 [Vittaforma corneae ATCC 50505]
MRTKLNPMVLNHKAEKAKQDNRPRDETGGFKMDRVMSAPPQQTIEEFSTSSMPSVFFNNENSISDLSTHEFLESITGKKGEGHNSTCQMSDLKSMLSELSLKDSNDVNIFDCDSEENGQLSEFVKFMQIERLLKQFPPLDIDALNDKINSILKINERTPVDIKFYFAKGEDIYLEKIKNLKSKVDSPIEKVRVEFNRVTKSNVGSVVENLFKIQIEKIEEMKEIAAFVFEKVISEEVFFNVYIKIIGELYKTWLCDEEKKIKNCKQSCFFGTLLSLAFKKFESQHNWFAQVDESILSTNSTSDIDEKIEECFAEKSKRRLHALGTVNFVIALYINNITGVHNVTVIIDKLTSTFTPENVVMLCHVFGSLGHKLLANNRRETLKKILDYLKSHSKCGDLRLEVEIDKTFSANVNLINALKSTPSPILQRSNSFASLVVEESKKVEKLKSDDDVLREYIMDIGDCLDSISDPDDLLEVGDKIFKDIDKFNNRKFLKAYFIEMITNHKIYQKFLNVLLNKLVPKAISPAEALFDVKEEMSILSIDFPCSTRNFSEFLCHAKARDMITHEEFEKLKPNEFFKRAGNLLREWRDSKDNRLPKVLSEEDIIQKL